MRYSTIKGLKISKYTLGTVQLGMSYGIANKSGQPDVSKSFRILDTALGSGVNAIDMASDYGTAEEVVGKYLQTMDAAKEKPLLVTKFTIDRTGTLTSDDIEQQIRRFVGEALNHLQISRIPIFLLHRVDDLYDYGEPISKALRKLIGEGLVGKAGVSVYNGAEVEKMLEDDLYEVVQVPMNIIDHRLVKKGVMEKLRRRNFLVFVRSVFLQGLFFLNPDELSPNLKDAREPLLMLRALAKEAGVSVAQLALTYIRDMDGVASLVIGAETPDQVKSNVALINTPPLAAELRKRIDDAFGSVPNHVLNPSAWNKPELWAQVDQAE